MTTLQMWALVAGFLSPPVIALIQQPKWPSRLRAVITFAWSLILAAVTVGINGDFTGRKWIEVSLTILVSAIATYHGLWKPTEIAPKIETVTTPKAGP
jgi:hypothetical protein